MLASRLAISNRLLHSQKVLLAGFILCSISYILSMFFYFVNKVQDSSIIGMTMILINSVYFISVYYDLDKLRLDINYKLI